jgi:hypothetical protein
VHGKHTVTSAASFANAMVAERVRFLPRHSRLKFDPVGYVAPAPWLPWPAKMDSLAMTAVAETV